MEEKIKQENITMNKTLQDKSYLYGKKNMAL